MFFQFSKKHKYSNPYSKLLVLLLALLVLGNYVGQEVAKKAKGFKMKILYHSRTRKGDQEKCLGKD